jgi:hypothetical protein
MCGKDGAMARRRKVLDRVLDGVVKAKPVRRVLGPLSSPLFTEDVSGIVRKVREGRLASLLKPWRPEDSGPQR